MTNKERLLSIMVEDRELEIDCLKAELSYVKTCNWVLFIGSVLLGGFTSYALFTNELTLLYQLLNEGFHYWFNQW